MVWYIWIKVFDKIFIIIFEIIKTYILRIFNSLKASAENVTTAVTTHNKVSTLSSLACYEVSTQNTISGNTYNLLHLFCEKLQWKPIFWQCVTVLMCVFMCVFMCDWSGVKLTCWQNNDAIWEVAYTSLQLLWHSWFTLVNRFLHVYLCMTGVRVKVPLAHLAGFKLQCDVAP